MIAETERLENVVEGRNIMDTGLGTTSGSHDPLAQDSAGTTGGGSPPPPPGIESRGDRQMRKPSFHLKSYPWYVSDWRMSETRMRLCPTARYIYRELIDHCYIEGSLPDDECILARIADVPLREFRRHWPSIKVSFESGSDGRLHNSKADEVLPELERWHQQKRSAGQAGGMAKAVANAKRSLSERQAVALAPLKPSTSTSTSTSNPLPPIDDLCREFYEAYPKQGQKKPGLVEHWYAANVGTYVAPEALHQRIMAGLNRAKQSAEWEKQDGKFICGALPFLEARRWEEDWPASECHETPIWTPRDDD